MTNIPTNQTLKRFKSLPQNLKDSLFSVQTAEIIRATCEQNHIPPEKNPEIAAAVGLVLLGFIHPEDLAKEIEDGAKIATQAASIIADALNKKLFAPIRVDLDKIYTPTPHDHEIEEQIPVIVEEIKKPRPTFPAENLGGQAVVSKPVETAEVAEPKPVDIEDIFRPTRPAPPSPSQISQGKTWEGKPEMKAPLGEFSKLGLGPSTPSTGSGYKTGDTEGGPKIIQEGLGIKPGPAAGFRIMDMPTPKFSDVDKKPPPPMPATIEFPSFIKASEGKPDSRKESAPLSRETTTNKTPRVVNYTELKTPLEKPFDTSYGKSFDIAQDIKLKPQIIERRPLIGDEKMMHPGSRSSTGSAETPPVVSPSTPSTSSGYKTGDAVAKQKPRIEPPPIRRPSDSAPERKPDPPPKPPYPQGGKS